MGSSTSNGGKALLLCEDKLTVDGQTIVQNPGSNQKVDGVYKSIRSTLTYRRSISD